MTPFAWLIGFVLPACGADGPAGLPPPGVMDMTRLERPASPNTFLAGPAGMTPPPDRTLAPEPVPADRLYDTARTTFEHQPRTFVAAEYPARHQAHFVVRSRLMNYPDLVTMQVDPVDATHSTLTIWSRSVYGRSDFGVNRTRTETWLAALKQSLEK